MTEEWVADHTRQLIQARSIVNPEERAQRLDFLEQERIYETLRCQAHMSQRIKSQGCAIDGLTEDMRHLAQCQRECADKRRIEEAEKEGMEKGARMTYEAMKWIGGILVGSGGATAVLKFLGE